MAAVVGLIVLSAGGALPAIAVARFRLVTIPLVPLTGAVLAALSATAMTGIGGTLLGWYVALSAVCAATCAITWWRYPISRPQVRKTGVAPGRGIAVTTFAVVVGASAFGLSQLVNPVVSYDGRAIWLLHPLWYKAGHTVSVAALRNAALVFSHPQYPPLVGGTVALSWTVSGLSTVRSGVVMIALLNALAVVAASTGAMELARHIVQSSSSDSTIASRFGRASVLGAGAVCSVLLALTAFREAGIALIDGHADLLWAAAAVGAVTYGLVLPWKRGHLGAALLLACVAGTTKSEGTATAAWIIALIGLRGVLVGRSLNLRRAYVQPVAFAFGSLAVIGLWPLVVHLLHALPNIEVSGARDGNDGSRLADTIRSAAPQLEVLVVTVPVAILGGVSLRARRRALGVGNDAFAWSAIVVAAAIVTAVYVTGPGSIQPWLSSSIDRTTLFPRLAAWWILASWVVIATATATAAAASSATGTPPPPVGSSDSSHVWPVESCDRTEHRSTPIASEDSASVRR